MSRDDRGNLFAPRVVEAIKAVIDARRLLNDAESALVGVARQASGRTSTEFSISIEVYDRTEDAMYGCIVRRSASGNVAVEVRRDDRFYVIGETAGGGVEVRGVPTGSDEDAAQVKEVEDGRLGDAEP